jgi:hypothetical protein
MAPILDENTEIPHEMTKYVREGGILAFQDDSEDHLSIAVKYKLGELDYETLKRKVDGSGWLYQDKNGVVFLSGASENCLHSKSYKVSKVEDAEVIRQITGKEVRY